MRWHHLLIVAFLVAYPLFASDPYLQRVGALVLLAAIGGSAWNLVGGYAGQISVGHATFYGIGAYIPLLAYNIWNWPPAAAIPIAVGLSAAIALLIGVPTFRLRGHYFTMATIALAEVIRLVAKNWSFVGASRGLTGPILGRSAWDLSFRSSVPYYYLFLVALAVLLAVTYFLERSRTGYYLRAIQSNERAARSLGIPAQRYKLFALILSACFTSLAGSFYATLIGFIDPDSVIGILVSVEMVIIAALGGVGTLFGPLLGAAILIPLQQWTNTLLGGGGSGVSHVVHGAVIMLIAIYEPAGLMGVWHRIARRSQRKGETTPHATSGA